MRIWGAGVGIWGLGGRRGITRRCVWGFFGGGGLMKWALMRQRIMALRIQSDRIWEARSRTVRRFFELAQHGFIICFCSLMRIATLRP